MSSFEKAFFITLKNEGGFSNDKDDPGKATKYGITEATLREYDPSLNVKDITQETAKKIYKANYWDRSKCDEICKLNQGLAVMVFDSGVNMGVGQAIKLLQRTINLFYHEKIDVDGVIGGQTLISLKLCLLKFEESFLDAYLAHWRMHYINIVNKNPVMKKFINGWLNRVRYTRSKINTYNN